MAKAKRGDTVRIHFNGFLEDGSIFESTITRDPFEFTLGEGCVISGVEDAILGMETGDIKTVKISPEDAYGGYNEEAITVIDRSQLPPHIEPEAGMLLKVRTVEDHITLVSVKDVSHDSVTLDANHPLAGKELTFEIHLLEIS